MAFTSVELTKDGKTRIAESPAAEAMLRFDGWLPTGTPVVVPVFDDKVRDLIEKKGSATELALRAASVAAMGLPAHAGSRARPFDSTRSIYNLKASNTRRVRAALGAARAGTGLARLGRSEREVG